MMLAGMTVGGSHAAPASGVAGGRTDPGDGVVVQPAARSAKARAMYLMPAGWHESRPGPIPHQAGPIKPAARAPIIAAVRFGCPLTMLGITDASATHSDVVP